MQRFWAHSIGASREQADHLCDDIETGLRSKPDAVGPDQPPQSEHSQWSETPALAIYLPIEFVSGRGPRELWPPFTPLKSRQRRMVAR